MSVDRPKCRRCHHRFDPAEGYVQVHFGGGETAVEQLDSWRSYDLCVECGFALKSWASIGFEGDPIAQEQIMQMDPDWDPS